MLITVFKIVHSIGFGWYWSVREDSKFQNSKRQSSRYGRCRISEGFACFYPIFCIYRNPIIPYNTSRLRPVLTCLRLVVTYTCPFVTFHFLVVMCLFTIVTCLLVHFPCVRVIDSLFQAVVLVCSLFMRQQFYDVLTHFHNDAVSLLLRYG